MTVADDTSVLCSSSMSIAQFSKILSQIGVCLLIAYASLASLFSNLHEIATLVHIFSKYFVFLLLSLCFAVEIL